jgi:hypothetical protein
VCAVLTDPQVEAWSTCSLISTACFEKRVRRADDPEVVPQSHRSGLRLQAARFLLRAADPLLTMAS